MSVVDIGDRFVKRDWSGSELGQSTEARLWGRYTLAFFRRHRFLSAIHKHHSSR